MDIFIEGHTFLKLSQEEIDLNILVPSKEIELVIETLMTEKSRARYIHWQILPNVLKRISTNTSQTLQKIRT